MALVFVAKDMQVANPVGQVNIHPLPALPAGLTRAHLLRSSLSAMNMNLVDGQLAEFVESDLYGEGNGAFIYDDDSIYSDWGSSGWFDPSWNIPYAGGFTFMAIAAISESIGRLMSSGEYATTAGGLVNFNIQPGGPRIRIGGTGLDYTWLNFSDPGEVPVMFFGAVHGGDLSRLVAVPHEGGYLEESFVSEDPPPAVIEGMVLAAARTSGSDVPADARLYMIAQWDRVLNQAEITSAYNALKPWLLARGVAIA